MHAKSGLRVVLKWIDFRPDSVIADVIPLNEMSIELRKFEPPDPDLKRPCWNLGYVTIEQSGARAILGQPHILVTDPRATAGGTEELWAFEITDFPEIFMRLRVPYSQMDVCVLSERIPANTWEVFLEIFPNHPNHRHEQIFNEMSHPDDPNCFYNGVF